MERNSITDADIFRSAGKMIRRHGHEAVMIADSRANEQLSQGNMDGYRMWKRIVLVIGELDMSTTPDNVWLN